MQWSIKRNQRLLCITFVRRCTWNRINFSNHLRIWIKRSNSNLWSNALNLQSTIIRLRKLSCKCQMTSDLLRAVSQIVNKKDYVFLLVLNSSQAWITQCSCQNHSHFNFNFKKNNLFFKHLLWKYNKEEHASS